MPTYVYEVIGAENSDGERFEVDQSMNDEPLTVHPETGQPVRRVILAPTLTLRHSDGAQKKMLDNKNVEAKGFTKYERDHATGQYHRVAGKEGPSTLQP